MRILRYYYLPYDESIRILVKILVNKGLNVNLKLATGSRCVNNRLTAFRLFTLMGWKVHNSGYTRFMEEGSNAMDAKDYWSAVRAYSEAISLNSRDAEAYNSRAAARIKVSRFEDAIEDADRAIFLNPSHNRAYYWRGVAKRLLNRYDEAIEDLNISLRLDLSDRAHQVYYNLAESYRLLKQYSIAMEYANRSIQLDPSYPYPYYTRASISFYRDKNYSQCIRDCMECQRLDKNANGVQIVNLLAKAREASGEQKPTSSYSPRIFDHSRQARREEELTRLRRELASAGPARSESAYEEQVQTSQRIRDLETSDQTCRIS